MICRKFSSMNLFVKKNKLLFRYAEEIIKSMQTYYFIFYNTDF